MPIITLLFHLAFSNGSLVQSFINVHKLKLGSANISIMIRYIACGVCFNEKNYML